MQELIQILEAPIVPRTPSFTIRTHSFQCCCMHDPSEAQMIVLFAEENVLFDRRREDPYEEEQVEVQCSAMFTNTNMILEGDSSMSHTCAFYHRNGRFRRRWREAATSTRENDVNDHGRKRLTDLAGAYGSHHADQLARLGFEDDIFQSECRFLSRER